MPAMTPSGKIAQPRVLLASTVSCFRNVTIPTRDARLQRRASQIIILAPCLGSISLGTKWIPFPRIGSEGSRPLHKKYSISFGMFNFGPNWRFLLPKQGSSAGAASTRSATTEPRNRKWGSPIMNHPSAWEQSTSYFRPRCGAACGNPRLHQAPSSAN